MDIDRSIISERIRCPGLASKIMSADDAADLMKNSSVVGISGFTSSGYPKEVPLSLAAKAKAGEDISFAPAKTGSVSVAGF